jgi:hypothetical protein
MLVLMDRDIFTFAGPTRHFLDLNSYKSFEVSDPLCL